MPLVNDKMNAKQYVQNRESVTHHGRAENRSLTPQPNSSRDRSQQRQDEARRKLQQASHGKGNSEAISRRDAAQLKLDVPNTLTISSSKHAQPADHGVLQEPAVAPPSIFSRPGPSVEHRHNAFDDTQSIHLDDTMSVVEEKPPRLSKPSFSFHHGRDMPPIWTDEPPIPPPTHHFEGSKLLFGERDKTSGLPADWQARADAERLRHGFEAKHSARFGHHIGQAKHGKDDHEEGSDQDGDIEEGTSIVENTPSRTRMGPEAKVTSKHGKEKKLKKGHRPEERASHPTLKHRKSLSDIAPAVVVEPSSRQQINRFNVYKSLETEPEMVLADNLRQTIQIPQPNSSLVHPPAFSSKMSSLHESSSDEEQLQAANASNTVPLAIKRHRSELDLDFDPDVLKTKTMADLDAIPFTADPRWSAPEPALDANGTPLSLSAKLTNLTKIRSEDQRNLFKSLNDAEREQTAEWFVEKFKADMQRLMAVRLERRKIALKYELEVRKREKEVELKTGDVDQELAGLKKGGGELIRGKSPAK
ncbi:hypothetical protein AYL99_05042 [Fonsecaea erecta]|uniref:Extracellular mutant protein 11 C-terminal domain-containing protein n=1 Tax=Fonsecaea erecta TaxID=1367422 RepID=A0A178ZJR6_9EURO|nr:hypothetical protein AYL99_05042 [Fonsecaea erecta]OAP60040.1 hypothetical protein AYL99_05042 [Fonsecaea erecta]